MGTKIFGSAAVQCRDLAGETILIDNMNIDHMRYVNDEHSKDFFSLLGGVSVAKKILSAKDISDKKQKQVWDFVGQVPFLYVEAELADDTDHPNAKAAASMLRYCAQHPELPLKVGFSVEGAIYERSGDDKKTLSATDGEGVSLTIKPCNKKSAVFLEQSLQKSWAPAVMPQKYIDALKAGGVTPSFKEVMNKSLSDKVESLKKSIMDYAATTTSLKCQQCGESEKFFRDSAHWPNICHNCGSGFKMSQLYSALKETKK